MVEDKNMGWLITKYLLTAGIIVGVSEVFNHVRYAF